MEDKPEAKKTRRKPDWRVFERINNDAVVAGEGGIGHNDFRERKAGFTSQAEALTWMKDSIVDGVTLVAVRIGGSVSMTVEQVNKVVVT